MDKNNLNLAIIGYGSMGKEVEKAAINKHFNVSNIFDIDCPIVENMDYDFDVAIDFSNAGALIDNVNKIAKKQKNIVIGTTGWSSQMDIIKEICEENHIGCIWSANFSIGMQLFFKSIAQITYLTSAFNLYDIFVNEIHHSNKTDSPSGTALRLGNIILENSHEKDILLTEQINRKISSNELQIAALRGGSINGTHTVYFDSLADTIELTHRAKNRRGFAEGALLAAEWINGKSDFYCFDDVLFDIKKD